MPVLASLEKCGENNYQMVLVKIWLYLSGWQGLPGGSVVKNPPSSAGDPADGGSIPGLGRSSSGGNGNPLQCSGQENLMERGAWRATVHGVTKSGPRLSEHAHVHTQTGRDSEVHVHWIGIHRFHGSILLIASLSTAWATASKRVRTVYQQHLVSVLDCLSGMAFACILLLCSVPSMIYSEWTASSLVSDQCSRLWTIREVVGTREEYPPIPGQTGERRNQMKLFQGTKKWLEHIPHSRKNFDKTNTSCDQMWAPLDANINS